MINKSKDSINSAVVLPKERNKSANVVLVFIVAGVLFLVSLIGAITFLFVRPGGSFNVTKVLVLREIKKLFPEQYQFKNNQEKDLLQKAADEKDINTQITLV